MEEDPNNAPAAEDTSPTSDGTTEDGGLMVLVTDSFGETPPDGGETETGSGNG